MNKFVQLARVCVLGVSVSLAGASVPVLAQTSPTEIDVPAEAADMIWRDVITGQLEAFRRGDAMGAFSFAGAAFHAQFSDPEMFFGAIRQSGYGALMDSRSHSFGKFSVEDDNVFQIITFYGPDQKIYEALYTLGEPDAGWRVQGVLVRPQAGIGI